MSRVPALAALPAWVQIALLALALTLGGALGGCQSGSGGTTNAGTRSAAGSGSSGSSQTEETSPELVGTSRAPTAAEQRIISGLMRDAASMRGLAFLRDVPAAIQDAARIRAFVEADAEADELAEAKELYVALGLLPADIDLIALLLEVLGEQIVGYYDPEAGRLVVRDDVMRTLARGGVDEGRIVLVHELVHALQDQHLGLGELNEAERDTDADNAYRGLVEGDATLAMMAYVLHGQGVPLAQLTSDPVTLRRFFENAPSSESSGGALDSAPAILRVTLTAPYTQGALFCGERYRAGGWPGVDSAHRELPVSTEQILHPDKFAQGELPDVIAIPALSGLESLGYARSNEDTLGELEMSIYFAQGTASDRDIPAAAGWSGDRLAIYSRPGAASAAIWWSSWDTEADAIEAETAANRANAGVQGRVLRQGRALLIVRHLPATASAEVVAAFGGFASALPATSPRRTRP